MVAASFVSWKSPQEEKERMTEKNRDSDISIPRELLEDLLREVRAIRNILKGEETG